MEEVRNVLLWRIFVATDSVCVSIVAAWWVVWTLWVHEREVRLHGELCEWVVMRYGFMVSCEMVRCGWACGCMVVCWGHGWVEGGVWLHGSEVRVSMWLGAVAWWGMKETLSFIWTVWELWDGSSAWVEVWVVCRLWAGCVRAMCGLCAGYNIQESILFKLEVSSVTHIPYYYQSSAWFP